MATYTKTYRQNHRTADTSLEQFELYVGVDQMPDFDISTQPVAVGASLPLSYTPDPAPSGGSVQLYCVTRKRNRYNLLSFNQYPSIIAINDIGDEELGPISAPGIIKIVNGVSGEIIVFARYVSGIDREEGDTWELYVEDGVDPDPSVDTPVATEEFGGVPRNDWHWNISEDGLTPGNTYHVMVVVRRSIDSNDGEEGESPVVEHVAAITYDIDADQASLFGGADYEIGQ